MSEYNKQDWRWRNVVWIKAACTLRGQTLFVNNVLQSRVFDLAGESTPDTLVAYEPILTSPRQLVLVDNDPKCFAGAWFNVEQRLTSKRWPRIVFAPDAYNLLASINRGEKKGDTEGPIGVISLDLINQAGSKWWNMDGTWLFDHVVDPSIEKYGLCILILNHVLDGHASHEAVSTRFEEHIEGLRGKLYRYGKREVMRSELLPCRKDVDSFINSGQNDGQLHRVQVYKSLGKRCRMATVRLYLQANSHRIEGNVR